LTRSLGSRFSEDFSFHITPQDHVVSAFHPRREVNSHWT
jgi:hypothetical protein